MNDCFTTKNIKDLRIVAKVVGADKNTSVKINNWTAYEHLINIKCFLIAEF